MKLSRDTKAFMVIGIALITSITALFFDIIIINNWLNENFLWNLSISSFILEILTGILIGFAIYIRFPNEITKIMPGVTGALVSGLLFLEYKQKWFNIDYNLVFIFFLILHLIFVAGFTYFIVMDRRYVEFILVDSPRPIDPDNSA